MTSRHNLDQTGQPVGQDTGTGGLAGVILGDVLVGLDGAGIRRNAAAGDRVSLHLAEPRRSTALMLTTRPEMSKAPGTNGLARCIRKQPLTMRHGGSGSGSGPGPGSAEPEPKRHWSERECYGWYPSSKMVHRSMPAMLRCEPIQGSCWNRSRTACSDSALTTRTTRCSSASGPPSITTPSATRASMNAACSAKPD